ncbi:MAG TPA: hypothetical protein VEK07_18995 [Polyangiaceae bacterium]|nr:hypothetical protein [Polyangiaceae bacterium]
MLWRSARARPGRSCFCWTGCGTEAWTGAGVSIVRLGDERAGIDYSGCELFDIAYFREGVRTVLAALLAHVSERPEVQILPQTQSGEGRFLAQWT